MAITGHSLVGKIMWQTSYSRNPYLYCRVLLWHSTRGGAWILDPFTGSSTTGIAANLLGRRFLGIDREEEYLILSKNRKKEIEQIAKFSLYHKKIKDISLLNNAERMSVHEKEVSIYDLPF